MADENKQAESYLEALNMIVVQFGRIADAIEQLSGDVQSVIRSTAGGPYIRHGGIN